MKYAIGRRGLVYDLLVLLICPLAIAQSRGAVLAESSSTYALFQVPDNSCPQNNVCTVPTAINSQGTVTGWYLDAKGIIHGFVRLADGTITKFDVPGSGTACTGYYNGCAFPAAINAAGPIVGRTSNGTRTSGFIRDAEGNFTVFDPPGSRETMATAIDSAGTVVGSYTDSDGASSNFVRDPSGDYTSAGVPGYASVIAGMSPKGEIVGTYSSYLGRGMFIQETDGKLKKVAIPSGFDSASPCAINDSGDVAGNDIPATYPSNPEAFLLDAKENFTSFAVIDGAPEGSTYTSAVGIDDQGTVLGDYYANHAEQGFYRLKDGTIGTFNPPDSIYTVPAAISPAGGITGWFIARDGSIPAFIRTTN